MVEITMDRSEFKRAVERAYRSGPEARRKALLSVVAMFGREVQTRAPVFTGRFKRAEAQAINAVGAGPLPLQPIKKPEDSKWTKGVARGLAKQRAYWQRRVNEIVAAGQHLRLGKKGKLLKGETAVYRRAQKQLALAIQYQTEWYASGGTAAVINQKRIGYNKLTRAYAKVYGGTGSVLQSEADTVVRLKNMEPHAYIVDKKKQVRNRALAVLGRDIVERAGRAYVGRMAEATGFRQTS